MMQKQRIALRLAMLSCLATLQPAFAAEPARQPEEITYARIGDHALALDLHMPAGAAQPPLVVYVHGGAWRAGNKDEYPAFLVAQGFAVASIDFRASSEARFPADLHDIKAAVRFLRAKAKQYGYAGERIAISGASSGAHLAAMVATTGGMPELEGSVGEFPRESSTVQALVSWFGASNLDTILAQSTPFGLSVRVPALQLLLGGVPKEVPALAKLASPVTHVSADDPPALLLHGKRDEQMPMQQTVELEAAYRRAGVPVEMILLEEAGHGGDAFYNGEPAARVLAFLRKNLLR
jgi:acetyl esterase/lipase